MSEKFSRRSFFKILASSALLASPALALAPRKASLKNKYDFYGIHQQGITTPTQKHIYFAVLSLHTDSIKEIEELFKTWTIYSTNLTNGKNVQDYGNNPYIPPIDTGEADSLNPYDLTLTFGVSPSFFDKLNIQKVKPKELNDLPHFPRDQLRAEYIGGDICIQACANDPQVAFHAVRNLVRVARAFVSLKWSQSGFNSFENTQTPRNLFGFKDGSANKLTKGEDIWYKGDNWLKNGSFLVARRIQMFLETWDRTNLFSQEETFARYKDSGAALGQKNEFDKIDLEKMDEKNEPLIPQYSHTALAHKTGLKILRRSFSYASGVDARTGQFDAGLLFISFQSDPSIFVQIQNSLGNKDKMNEYITHIGSGLFACFAGVKNDGKDFLAKALFDSI